MATEKVQKAAKRPAKPQASQMRAALNGVLFMAGFTAILFFLDTPENDVDPLSIIIRMSATFAVLVVLHVAVLRKMTSPYYIAHIIINFSICVLTFPDLVYILTDTVDALKVTKVNTWALELCNALHLYHVAVFTDLRFVDYLHHIVMVFFCMPLFYVAEYGPLANYNMFFVSGLPGGLDYIMLCLVREKKMKKLEEKKWNTSINIWLRGPFLLGSVFFSHVQVSLLRDVLSTSQIICRYICQAIQFWNAMYFTESVVGDYYRLSLQRGKIALYHDLSEDEEEEDKNGGVAVTERLIGGAKSAQKED
eukprot:TRINITY_DN24001_c0_g1_i1.p1 TRINITY_DN24001_c0_g1~~TRINITY_DN24001_c0_g1_i1.p1  ORF type:complete len:307 (+),score=98.24 TRINITY_DN24001_c0_g1_i1:50-970(+)